MTARGATYSVPTRLATAVGDNFVHYGSAGPTVLVGGGTPPPPTSPTTGQLWPRGSP